MGISYELLVSMPQTHSSQMVVCIQDFVVKTNKTTCRPNTCIYRY